ncbi:photosystem II reaction center protein PsbN [Pseudanabaena sp. PCC 6802]|nr:photosystem II reaction center protein PsbN [Pseudanabaena sp. PCC 6802]
MTALSIYTAFGSPNKKLSNPCEDCKD